MHIIRGYNGCITPCVVCTTTLVRIIHRARYAQPNKYMHFFTLLFSLYIKTFHVTTYNCCLLMASYIVFILWVIHNWSNQALFGRYLGCFQMCFYGDAVGIVVYVISFTFISLSMVSFPGSGITGPKLIMPDAL